MLVAATFLLCVAAVKAYQFSTRGKREAASGAAANPSVGMHGALVEPRR